MIELLHGDCLELMKELPDNSIDMVLTSPPYDNLRNYNNSSKWSFDIFKEVATELKRLICKGGVIVWVVGDASINGSETGTSFKQALYFKDELNLRIHDTMIYAKKNVVPLTHRRYEQAFEYMFILSKDRPKTFNGIKDKPNKYAGTKVHGTQYKKDKPVRISGHNKKIIAKHGLRHNISYYSNAGNKIKHPAMFPIELANDHIKTWTNEGDIVLDCFMGSGTTGIGCKNLNRKFIGIEKDNKYFDIAKERINVSD